MKTFHFGLAVISSLFGLGENVAVSLSPPGVPTWINRPTTTWSCKVGRNRATVFSISKIKTAADHLLPLWAYEEKEAWARRQYFPLSVDTEGIKGWQDQVFGKTPIPLRFKTNFIPVGQSLHKLCYQKYWTGGYPILNVTEVENSTKWTDPGQFRVLVSGAYVADKWTGDGAFAFCGLARLLDPSDGYSYEMCWANPPRNQEAEEEIIFV
ncbi:hypothetical protein FRC08_004058 [Ceratobasidium sp. 394]|nr:hypothetical protein FRC08_004058 [Ceratobasidium sp. 394]KAG9091658.1 hypothetical protein FS749_016367 [Ceratobasidium sp. UAMH 11750]